MFFSLTLNRFSILCRQKGGKRANLKTVVTRKPVKARHIFQKNEHFLPHDTHTCTRKPFCLITDDFVLWGKVNNKHTETTSSYVFLIDFEYANVR